MSRWIDPTDAELWRSVELQVPRACRRGLAKAGRVFLAGDAAHQQPPFLGQGLCQGVRDVADLTWKLGASFRNGVVSRLLDSYGAERSAHVRRLHPSSSASAVSWQSGTKLRHAPRCRVGGTGRWHHPDFLSTAPNSCSRRCQPAASSPRSNAGRGSLFPQPMVARSPAPNYWTS